MCKGEIVRHVDVEGQEGVEFLCFSAGDLAERYNGGKTSKLNRNIYRGKGTELWSVRGRKMMTINEDTGGSHDTLYGCCSVEVDDIRFGKNNGRGCQGNFEFELAKHGLSEKDVVANVNFFMYVPVEASGDLAIAPGISKPTDYVDLRAEMDLLAVLSNCPEALNNAAGFKPTPIRAIVYSL